MGGSHAAFASAPLVCASAPAASRVWLAANGGGLGCAPVPVRARFFRGVLSVSLKNPGTRPGTSLFSRSVILYLG